MSDNATVNLTTRPDDGPQLLSGLGLLTGIIGPPPFPPPDAITIFAAAIHASVRQDFVLARFVDEAGQQEVIADRLALLASQGHLTNDEARVVNSTVIADTDAAIAYGADLPVVNSTGGLALARVLTTIANRSRGPVGVDFSAAGTFTVVMAAIGGAVVGGACFGPAGAAIGAETAAGVAASAVAE